MDTVLQKDTPQTVAQPFQGGGGGHIYGESPTPRFNAFFTRSPSTTHPHARAEALARFCDELLHPDDIFKRPLSTPDAHKTAAIFGPSTTAVPGAACALLQAWLAEAGLTANAAAKPYVFVLGSHARGAGAVDHAKPLGTPRWTEVVKAVLKRQAGVAFTPKDLRSSFITFLLSDANTNEALKKAVATAMRHSTALQGSATYDKERAERTWASAVQVAGAYAARFE
jgi:hypothetical protein